MRAELLRVPNWVWCRAGLFAVIYTLLILPWPGLDEVYSSWFRALNTAVFARNDQPRMVRFEPLTTNHGFEATDTRMILGNRNLVDPQGHGPVEKMDMDVQSLAWTPTALTLALIAASPISWRRKLLALAAGLLLIHAFILFSIQTCIWNASNSVQLLNLSPFWQLVVDALCYTFYGQMGIDFTVPVIIWIAVTFQRGDFARLFPGNKDV